LSFSWNSIPEARQLLISIRQKQKELRLVKKDILQSMKEVRSSFKTQRATVQVRLLTRLAGYKAVIHSRASKRENLRQQEVTRLAPYQSIAHIIDETLVRLDGVKLEIETWIASKDENS
jgi:hypothetical protein